MEVKILIIEDHSSMIEGYKNILSLNKEGYTFQFFDASNCESAYYIITNPENNSFFDVVFLDHSLQSFQEKNMYSGKDLGSLIRQYMPTTKIIMLTSFTDSITLFEVVKKFQPNGLLIKSDFEAPVLLEALTKVLAGETYYSPQAAQSIKEPLFAKGFLDSIDREIIVLIAQGLQISSIAKRLNIADDTIKKRKSKIKDLLGIEKGGDEDILRECRALGLL